MSRELENQIQDWLIQVVSSIKYSSAVYLAKMRLSIRNYAMFGRQCGAFTAATFLAGIYPFLTKCLLEDSNSPTGYQTTPAIYGEYTAISMRNFHLRNVFQIRCLKSQPMPDKRDWPCVFCLEQSRQFCDVKYNDSTRAAHGNSFIKSELECVYDQHVSSHF